MTARVARSNETSPGAACAEIKKVIGGPDVRAVLYFASSCYKLDEVAGQMQESFGPTPTMGCSTAGELISGAMTTNSIVAMALTSDELMDVDVQVVDDVRRRESLDRALVGFEKHFGIAMRGMPSEQFVGIVLIDGLSLSEESVMDQIGNYTDVLFLGGSAGDDLKFKQTLVCANGKAYAGAAVLAVLRVKNGFDIIKTQSFRATDKILKATKVDESRRSVLEFDGQPAAQAYAQAVGTPLDKAHERFMRNPVGLMVDTDPFVRSPQQISGDEIVFYCAVKEGMDLRLLESTNIVEDTMLAVRMHQRARPVSAMINFHCILRTLELQAIGQTDAYGNIFKDIPTIGFSTYGEEYIGHINQTSTILAIG